MHSSGMSTARLFPVSPSMHCSEGYAWFWSKGGACLWSRGGVVYSWGGACLWSRGSAPGGWGGCLLLDGWWCIPACNGADPHVNRMTDRCKNITLPQTSFGGAKYCTQVTRTQVLKYRADVTKTGGISGPTKRTDVLQKLKNGLLFLIYGHFRSSVNVLYVLNGIECFNRPH